MEGALFLIAVALLAAWAWGLAQPWIFERVAGPAFDRALAVRAEGGAVATVEEATVPGSVLARLEIPTAGISTLVVEGTGSEQLSRAVGRISGTARFGDPGTVGLAGHRDAQFQRLGNVRAGDWCLVTTPAATYEYVIESTATVSPDSVEILHASADRRLALVTCYPFRYIGPAPERFVVFARQVTKESTWVVGSDDSSSAAGAPFIP